jgi:hypothetical protein
LREASNPNSIRGFVSKTTHDAAFQQVSKMFGSVPINMLLPLLQLHHHRFEEQPAMTCVVGQELVPEVLYWSEPRILHLLQQQKAPPKQ